MRYSRQEKVIGKENQQLVEQAKVAIVGIGALGSIASELLTRAGVKELLLIDRDIVEESNLQRQFLFTEKDIDKSKAQAAKEKLEKINSKANIKIKAIHLNEKNIDYLNDYDLILDCTDNLTTRFTIDNYSHKTAKPWIYAAAIKTAGYVMPIIPDGPCLNDFLKQASLETCQSAGVLNTIACAIAALQVNFALKIIAKEKIEPFLHYLNIETLEFKKLKINKTEQEHNNQKDSLTQFCSGRFQLFGPEIDFAKLKSRYPELIDEGVTLRFKDLILFKDGRVLIKAKDKKEAQSKYSKFIGN